MPTTNIADLDLDIPAEKLILDEVIRFYVMPFVVDENDQVSPAYPNDKPDGFGVYASLKAGETTNYAWGLSQHLKDCDKQESADKIRAALNDILLIHTCQHLAPDAELEADYEGRINGSDE
jgi:hypothetical protein